MKKLYLGFAALLLGSSLTYGYDAGGTLNNSVVGQQATVASSEEVSGLTPKRPATAVIRAQQPAPLVPVAPFVTRSSEPLRVAQAAPAEPVSGGNDAFLFSEIERLNGEIQKIKKDTAKPDTKKAWSAPKIAGRIFLDSVNFVDQNAESRALGNRPNAAGFRELRLGASGNGYDAFDYKVEFGFQNNTGRVALIDNWVGVKNVPLLGYVRAGHFKPETGLYYPMGTTNVSMMEYITPSNIFGLGRRIGISSEHLFANDRIRLFFGVFQSAATDMDRYLKEDNQGQIVNLRLSAAPWFGQEGKYVLHVGGHWEYVSLDSNANKTASLNAAPGTFSWADASLQSGSFANDYSNRGGLELAYQCGRFSARSELFAGSFAAYNTTPGRHLYGSYVELGYFLTDGFRTYDLKSGSFGAVKMKDNFHPFKSGCWNLVDGFGAWQAVVQWGYTDMEDWRGTNTAPANQTANTLGGGHQNDFVAGMNWFWSPQMRWMFEYVRSEQCVGNAYSHRSQDIFATSIRYNW